MSDNTVAGSSQAPKKRRSLFGEVTCNGPNSQADNIIYPSNYVNELLSRLNKYDTMLTEATNMKNNNPIPSTDAPQFSKEKTDYLNSIPDLDNYLANAEIFLNKFYAKQQKIEINRRKMKYIESQMIATAKTTVGL